MLRCLCFLFALAATLPVVRADAPTSYVVESTVAAVTSTSGEVFGSKFFFATGSQVVYRIVPADRVEGDPALSWDFWSPGGTSAVLPAENYDSLEIVALNPDGIAIGRNAASSPSREAALYWTAAEGAIVPEGFDGGFSGLKTINATGAAAGFTDGGSYRSVRWSAADPTTLEIITPPTGFPGAQIQGVSDSGDVLLFVTDPSGNPRAAVWNGDTSTLVGPPPDPGETFFPSNCVINGVGDVAILFFTDGGGYRIIFVPAADRTTFQIFSFPGPVTGAFTLQISDAGIASCQTSAGTVSIVSSPRAQQFTFSGYSPFVNAGGEFIYGSQGVLFYWDAAAWTGNPVPVPLAVPSAPSAPTVVGFNDDGRLLTLSDNANRTVRTLAILAPAVPPPAPPASVRVVPVRETLRVSAGVPIRQPLVRPKITGTLDGPIRYELRGNPPVGTRFRATDARLRGRPSQPQTSRLRVIARYSVDGIARQSAPARVRVVVRAPASPPN